MVTNEITKAVDTADIEQVLISGDLKSLTPAQRVSYYQRVCSSLGLNPLTKPFDYIMLNGKLTLYAKKDATDQVRNNRKVSITKLERERMDNIYVVTAYASSDSRQDSSIGAVNIENLKGDALANAMMKAETKAKRRVTLSICGLGWLDETEIETIKDAKPVTVRETGEIVTPPQNGWEPAQMPDQEPEITGEPEPMTGTITPKMLVDLKLSEDIPSAAHVINLLKIGGKDASTHLVIMRKYRAAKDNGKTTEEAVAEALA